MPWRKRAFDIVASSVLLALLAPLLAPVAVAIWITMGRPILFRQRRPGLNAAPFELIKFRTMRNPEGGEDTVAADGSRLTRLGRLMRASSLDELPELWNVLRGDMSLVGPRPLLMQYLDRYTPEQASRHCVKPGLTGWAQVNGRNAISWEEKFALDIWYIQNWSFLLDLKILAATMIKVLHGSNISGEGADTAHEFTGTANSDNHEQHSK